MATIIKGKHATKEVKIHQFCNDWFHIEHPDIPNQESIVKPTNLRFDESEVFEIKQAAEKQQTGNMFKLFYWDTPNTLRKKKFVA